MNAGSEVEMDRNAGPRSGIDDPGRWCVDVDGWRRRVVPAVHYRPVSVIAARWMVTMWPVRGAVVVIVVVNDRAVTFFTVMGVAGVGVHR